MAGFEKWAAALFPSSRIERQRLLKRLIEYWTFLSLAEIGGNEINQGERVVMSAAAFGSAPNNIYISRREWAHLRLALISGNTLSTRRRAKPALDLSVWMRDSVGNEKSYVFKAIQESLI